MDAVVSDFISGAAELLSPANAGDHWDIIEGQGALAHPSFAGVSLGLLHGSQPDALVLCHDPMRTHQIGAGSYPLPSISETISLNLLHARRVNPDARFVGVSVNTSGLSGQERWRVLEKYAVETRLPAVDPLIDGVAPIVDALIGGNVEAMAL